MAEQRLFISHASEDEAVVNRIVAYLEARGVACWISSRDIPPRAIYADAITEAMQACSACVVVLSKASNESKAVKRELELASHYDKSFIPIRIDDTEPATGVDYYLRNTQWLDFKRDGNAALDRIAAHVRGAPLPPPPARRIRSVQPIVLGGIALTIALISGCVWYAATQFASPPAATQNAAASAETLAPLLGSYNWDGVECGRGPTITYEDGVLVFTMPGTPTFRHEVLSVTAASNNNRLEVRSRVVSPEEHAGRTYTLGLNSDTLHLTADQRTDAWSLCDPEQMPAEAGQASAPIPPERTPVEATTALQFAESRWQMVTIGSTAIPSSAQDWTFTFENSNIVRLGSRANGTWSRNGLYVTWTLDSGALYEGRIRGTVLSGTATNNGVSVPFVMRRLD